MEKEIRINVSALFIIAAIFILFTWAVGFGAGVRSMKDENEKVEQSQGELRLDMKELKEDIEKLQLKEELMRIVKAIFQERDEIIDWNKNHIILTVEPKPKTEGN